MKSIVITPKDRSEYELISKLLKKMGIASKSISDEDREDIGLALLMKEADRNKKVNKEEVLRKLV